MSLVVGAVAGGAGVGDHVFHVFGVEVACGADVGANVHHASVWGHVGADVGAGVGEGVYCVCVVTPSLGTDGPCSFPIVSMENDDILTVSPHRLA